MTAAKQSPKSFRERLEALVWDGRLRLARWLCTQVFRLGPEELLAEGFYVRQEKCSHDPFVDMLYRVLGNRTGKLRVSEAFVICGLEAGKVNQDQIARFGRAIRELGWERRRRWFDYGVALEYAYVKGDATEREVELLVEYDPAMRSLRIVAA